MSILHWCGGATAVKDVWTLTITNTWAANDTISITVGNKTLILTVGATATTAQIATELIAAINNTSATAPTALGSGYSANFGGQQFPEFTEFTATSGGASIVVLTADTAGIPFTPSEVVDTAGDGDSAFVHTTSATGPNFLSNADNYLGGALPSDDDIIYFDIGEVDCLYDLNYFRDLPRTLNGVIFTNDWTGRLGLPFENANGYTEYRGRYFEMSSSADAYVHVLPGLLGNLECGDLLINLEDQVLTNITVTTFRNSTSGVPNVYLAGAHAATFSNTLTILKGAVAVEPDDAGTDVTKYSAFSAIKIGAVGGSDSECVVTFGVNHRMNQLTSALDHQSGTVRVQCSCTGETFKHYGGKWYIDPPCAVFGTHEVYAGAAIYPLTAGTFALAELFGGTIDHRVGTGTVAYTSGPKIYADSSFYDPAGRCSAALHLVGCAIPQLAALTLPSDKSYTLGSAAP